MSDELIKCAICNREFAVLINSHLKSHGLTQKEYVILYPDAPIMSENYRLRLSDRSKIVNAVRKGIPRSDEVKAKISKANKGKIGHNKGKHMSMELRALMSKARKEKYTSGEIIHWNTGNTTPDKVKAKISASLKGINYNTAASIIKRNRTRQSKKDNGWIPAQSTIEFKAHIKQQNQLKYGVDWVFQRPDIKEKIKQTCIKRYGVDNPLKSPQVIKKRQSTLLQRYGVLNCKYLWYDEGVREQLKDVNFLIDLHHNQKISIMQMAEQLNVTDITIRNYLNRHNIEQRFYNSSVGCNSLIDFIQSLSVEFYTNTRKIIGPSEIDIYLPEYKLGIEYNGIYWHSELKGRDSTYHINKFNSCNNVGVQLIQIYDIEWLHKQDIVTSIIKSILKLNENVELNYNIIEISINQASSFFNETHILSYIPAIIHVGLYHNDEIYAIMSFNDIELIQYSTKLNTNINNGAKLLLDYYIQAYNPIKVISYTNNRWNDGVQYTELGFNHIEHTTPKYYYFKHNDCQNLISKYDDIVELDFFNPELSEWENMQLNGYNRIWDCGSSKWELTI